MSNLELRLAALTKLVGVKSDAVDQRLGEEFGRLENALRQSTDYVELLEALKTLAVLVPRYHMATLPLLQSFVRSLPSRVLSQDGEPISGVRYRSSESLVREAIEVAEEARYLHTEQVTDFLLEMSRATDNEVVAKAERALELLATFDLEVFYGEPAQGAVPQKRMVTYLASLSDDVLLASSGIVLQILNKVLSPTIEGTSWSYHSITIRRGSIVSGGGVADMRAEAINLAKKVYCLDASVEHRRRVLQALDVATRRESVSATSDNETSAMFERDAIVVLEFLRDLVATEALPIVQFIEHQAYWDYYHGASQVVKNKALEVRDVLDAHAEYQIYKQLIGFEGIFGKWEELSRSQEAWEYGDEKRHLAAHRFLEEINDTTYAKWRDRILEFSRTRSNDLATFPVYYGFLQSIGEKRPRLALELLTDHEDVMEPFLIALIAGLWTSASATKLDQVVRGWLEEGRHLTAIAKSLYKTGSDRLELLAEVVDRALTLGARDSLIQAMGVAANLHSEGVADAKAVFMRALREMAKHNDPSWAQVIWFSRDFQALVVSMEVDERAEVLSTLISLPEIDYRAEEILYEIGKRDLQAVRDFLIARLKRARLLAKEKGNDSDQGRYESIPYHLTKLNKLLAQEPDALLATLRADYSAEICFMFAYRGARVVKSVFPEFSARLEGLLLPYVKAGNDDDLLFVIGILSTYGGSLEILGACKEIVKIVPERSKIWNELAAVIERTGVVGGEYGIAEALQRKLDAISGWMGDEDERIRAFAEWLTEGLQSHIKHERQRVDESIAVRKYRYGDDVGED
ncbi:hypothetical protein ACI2KO_02870 [Pseudomonas piscis]|uniref:hypothetical protein n=1 Tax=Pseudomonas piscis TaxID=2614538 RepID=UPI0038511C7D